MNVRSTAFTSLCIAGALLFSTGSGRCWISNGTPVCVAPNYQLAPTIVSDGAGGAYITWFDCRMDAINTDIFAQHIDSRGNPLWKKNGLEVCMAPEYQYGPIIGADGAGGAIIAWLDFRLGGCDLFAQRVNPAGQMLWGQDGAILNVLEGHQIDPHAVFVADEWGGGIFAWADECTEPDPYFPGGTVRRTDIYAQRLGGDGGYMMWDPFGVPVCTAPGYQLKPVIATDGAGGAIIAWLDSRHGYYNEVFAQRLTPVGGKLWLNNGSPVCQVYGERHGLGMISDDQGGAIFAWSDYRTSTFDIYAARLSGDATSLWAINAVPVTALPGEQRNPVICSDGAGGCIIAWEDGAEGNIDIYAQRVNGAGNLCWPAEGVPIARMRLDQYQLAIVSDGAGGAIITWLDNSDMEPAIRAQRVNAGGQVLWQPNGAFACQPGAQVYTPLVASDGAGGAIVSFADDRSGKTDVFAQRLAGDGELVATLLQSYAAALDGTQIRVTWTLAEQADEAEFRVLRADAHGEPLYASVQGTVEREGLSYAFADRAWEPGCSYRYRVDVIEGGERRTLFETDPVVTPALPLTLHQNHPNPFNPSTSIRFYLPYRRRVSLAVFDVAGGLVRRLLEAPMEKGSHTISWDGRNERGEIAPTGVYFCRLAAGRETLSRSMVLLR